MRPVDAIEKKPYEAPKLLVYGKLAEMTKTLGRHGSPDSARRKTGR
jgi:hypothetical protein